MSQIAIHRRNKRRSAGRPRALTLDDIVNTASNMEMNELSMAKVARELNVGTATLYGYVDGIEKLLELVSHRKRRLFPIADEGQNWQELVREHADQSYQQLIGWPDLVHQVMYRNCFTEAEAEYMEHFLGLLFQRGIPPTEALKLYHEINQLVLGSVVTSTYSRSLEENEEQKQLGAIPLFLKLSADDGQYPLIQEALEDVPEQSVLNSYSEALERLIAAYAERFG